MDKGRGCNRCNYSAGSGNKSTDEVVSVNSSEKTVNDRSLQSINVTKTKAQRKQTYGYDGTSYCKNRGRNEKTPICIADRRECRDYVRMRRIDGTCVGVCKKRYDLKQEKKHQQTNDIRNIQNISTYNGRRH